jgi:2-iminobutanoate/2-iminopropanoate deaminase
MIKKIETSEAPKAIGPYSQAVLAGGFLFLSGQLPLDPETGKLVQGDISAMTHQVFDNIEAILRKERLSLNNVVRMEVYLKDLGHFQEMNTIYALRMGEHKPARHAFQVAKLPLDAAIEITCTAYAG